MSAYKPKKGKYRPGKRYPKFMPRRKGKYRPGR